jgi:hypothetical protein
VSIFCLVSTSASGQQTASSAPPPTTSDPQAVALIQRSLAALIGSATVSDVTLTGTAQRIAGSDDETGTATLTAMPGGYSKLSLTLPSGARNEIRNPSGTPLPGVLPPNVPAAVAQTAQPVGAWSGPDGVPHGMASHNVMTDATWFFPAFTIANVLSSAGRTYILSYGGDAILGGQSVLHVSAFQQWSPASNAPSAIASLSQHLSQMDIYLNSTTSLPVALEFNAHPDANALVDIPVQIQFSNYQVVSGAAVPLRVQKYVNNVLVLDLQLNSSALNTGLTASSFQLQ